ncbi:MAG TPA: hypothetical protein DCL44_09275 [Elusimicrobia bacterium]|nr:hypothetical protein [Elusimicrobiota bacterium]
MVLPVMVYFMNKTSDKSENILRVLRRFDRPLSTYDPVDIQNAPQHIFLGNIYSPLLEYSPDGKLVSAVADQFQWVGNEAHFHINPNLKTIDGYKITAYDAENTLKRVFILHSNTHGDIKSILCPEAKFAKLSDCCPNMEVRDNGGLLVMKFKENKTFLFSMLTAMDYGIIPSRSVNPKSLAIIDYRNTSGPYYVDKVHENKNMDLKANPNHFHYSKKMPQKVELVYSSNKGPNEPINLFSNKTVDHIFTIGSTPDVLMDYAEKNKDVNLHATYPLWLRYFSFTRKGKTRLTEAERITIGKLVRKAVLPRYSKLKSYDPTGQIFPAFSKGALSDAQLDAVRKRYASVKEREVVTTKMTAWFFPEEDIPALKKYFPNTEFVNGPNVPCFVDFSKGKIKEPDFSFAGTDMGFQEDASLMAYKINTEDFHLTGEKGKEWLKAYLENPNEKQRIEMLRELHFATLEHADTVPLVFCPYASIVRKPWTLNFSKYTYDNPFWRIYKKP